MSRFLFVGFDGGGNVPALLAIARRLVGRGHAVCVLGDPTLERESLDAGCSYLPYETAPAHDPRDPARAIRDWAPGSPRGNLARVGKALMFGPSEAYARDALTAVERAAPDALAVDYMLFGALVGAERSGVPTAAIMHTIYALPAAGVPPFGMGLSPARGPLGRLRDATLRWAAARAFDRLGRPPINAARAALGLRPIASVFDQVWCRDRVLVLTATAFDFAARAALPPSVMFTGPELADPGWTAPWRSPWPPDATSPLVLVALGSTFQDQHHTTQRVIDVLGALPVRGLVTLGGVFLPSAFQLPANVIAVASAPHREVLPGAAAVVTHGGHGTMMKALAHGTPVLAIPLGRDQDDNAARLVASGAGLRVSRNASVRRIRRALERLLEDPDFTASARRLAGDIAREVAADRAIGELEALAARRTRTTD